ncbi:MAG TPA: Gfo/Idh/MocA family oxidoreductase [Mycobacteriales bacterium]|nr:Gfo/Idh/MocA family oxidoreductase [Mycobacteriales bacterium]
MSDQIRWGILGAGSISASFAADLQLLDGHRLLAVGSRRQASAEDFARRFDAPHPHGSYEDLCADPDVDVIYVGTPHPFHAEHSLLAIRAGKHVLCEKPFALNATEAAAVVTAAREAGVFCMEAMWTRFLPHMRRIRQLLDAGALGQVRTVIADHGQRFLPPDFTSRLYAPELGGGALLDLGIYPVSFASYVFGSPGRVTAVSDPAETGVDAQTSAVLQYGGGAHAVLTTTLGGSTPNLASITGTEGRIEIDSVWYQPTTFQLHTRSGAIQHFAQPRIGHGLRHQAEEVGRCLREGLTESPIMSLDETLSITATMDEIRRQIGLRYPSES